MKVMIITCSPNKDGLTETCGKAARMGVEDGKSEAVPVYHPRVSSPCINFKPAMCVKG